VVSILGKVQVGKTFLVNLFTKKNYVNSTNKCIDFVYTGDQLLVDTPSFDIALNYSEDLL
jgi:hypothetical protein